MERRGESAGLIRFIRCHPFRRMDPAGQKIIAPSGLIRPIRFIRPIRVTSLFQNQSHQPKMMGKIFKVVAR